MSDAMRAMLDGLMGSDRNLTEEARELNKRTFDSPEVDVTFLCGCSPWHLLADTNHEKMLPRNGWDKIQDDFLRREWEVLTQEEKDKYGFEHDTMKVLEDLVGQIDKRLYLNKQKITNGEENLPQEQRDKVFEIDQAIKQLQDKANDLGEQGDIDGSMACISEAGNLKETRDEIVEANKPMGRKEVVCEVTGALIPESDLHRLEGGKMFNGWRLMRKALKHYQERENPPLPKPRVTYREQEAQRRAEHDKARRQHEQKGSPRSRGTSSRGGDRGNGSRRDRSRSRGKDSRRSSRRSRSRSRDKRRRSRSREVRQSRSKSRDKQSKSKKEDKSRSRSPPAGNKMEELKKKQQELLDKKMKLEQLKSSAEAEAEAVQF